MGLSHLNIENYWTEIRAYSLNLLAELQSCFIISSFTEEYFFPSFLAVSFGIPPLMSSLSKAFLAFLTFQSRVNQIRARFITNVSRCTPVFTILEVFIFSPKNREKRAHSSSVIPLSASFCLILFSISSSISEEDFPPLLNFFIMSPRLVNTLM